MLDECSSPSARQPNTSVSRDEGRCPPSEAGGATRSPLEANAPTKNCSPPVVLPPMDVPDVPSPDLLSEPSPVKYWRPSAAIRDYSDQLIGRASGGGRGWSASHVDSAGGRGIVGAGTGTRRLSAREIRKALLGEPVESPGEQEPAPGISRTTAQF